MSGRYRHPPKEKGTLGKPYEWYEGFSLWWLLPTEHNGKIEAEQEYE